MVPKGWEIKHLSELASKISDGIHKTPLYADTSEIYFINGNNLKSGSIVIQDSTKCVDENDAINHRKDLGVRTLLMSINGTIGNLAYYRGENVVLGKSASYINIKDSVNLDFIYYVLSSSKTQAFYESELTGTTIRNLSIKSIKSTEILTPPLPEQKKIAQILSTWDKAISVTEKLLTNSQQQKKALMQQLLTGKKRLLDENGVRFSGEWEKYSLEELESLQWIELGRGKVISKKDILNMPGRYPIYSSSVKNGGLMGCYGMFMFDEELISWSVDGGGDFFYRPKHKFSVTNVSGYMRVQCSKISYPFLASQLQLQHSALEFDYQSKAHPSVIRKLYEVVLPELREQQKIAVVLSTADAEISTLEKKLACLKDEKKALMQQLLTGKRRVKVDEAVAE
ncbi:restriction endonuclease subunit S [Escherichia coli]|uniref:restriction endonuclease subunit S n=1 Tax=Escherichia coli TaxID=562 RepID=UPI002379834D|nr:restriction endonuclease subunit S [Escherichia coli]MDD8370157.1 restriction endonuclease subunit S [Escherichia coli]MDD8426271.1 restriction endonuclease subunit S [Escherichia coli]MDD8435712.1 restriction endonuclease subunit S [Escherichia coli]MDM1596253.1 restriction endonuclease subunit S [Escherichia coli]